MLCSCFGLSTDGCATILPGKHSSSSYCCAATATIESGGNLELVSLSSKSSITKSVLLIPQESCWMDSGDLSHPILWILSKMRRSSLSNKETP